VDDVLFSGRTARAAMDAPEMILAGPEKLNWPCWWTAAIVNCDQGGFRR